MSLRWREMRVRSAVPPLCLAMVFLLGSLGCGLSQHQLAKIETYSPATADLAAVSSEALTRVRQDVRALQAKKRSIERLFLKQDEAEDLEPLSSEQLEKRLRATSVLRQYAELLDALARDDYTPRLQSQVNTMFANLNRIEGIHVSESRRDAIGALVVKVGGLFIEYQRAKAMREVIAETKDPIRSLIENLRADFDPEAVLWAADLKQTKSEIEMDLLVAIQSLRSIEDLHQETVTAERRVAEARRKAALAEGTVQRDATLLADANDTFRNALRAVVTASGGGESNEEAMRVQDEKLAAFAEAKAAHAKALEGKANADRALAKSLAELQSAADLEESARAALSGESEDVSPEAEDLRATILRGPELAMVKNEYQKLRVEAEERWQAFLAVQPRIQEAMVRFTQAQNELVRVMEQPEFSAEHIDAFLLEVEQLHRLYRAIHLN